MTGWQVMYDLGSRCVASKRLGGGENLELESFVFSGYVVVSSPFTPRAVVLWLR